MTNVDDERNRMSNTNGQSVQERFVALIADRLADGVHGGRVFGPDKATISLCRCDVFADGRVVSWDLGEIPLDDQGRAAVAAAFAAARAGLRTYDGRAWLAAFEGRTARA